MATPHPGQDPDHDPSQDEADELALALEALEMAEQLIHECAYLCLDPVDAPTVDQLRAVQAFFPEVNQLALRRELMEGTLRIGPLLPSAVTDFAHLSLRNVGLAWHSEPPSPQDLARLGFGAKQHV